MAAKTWVVEPENASVVHVPTGMRIHFVQDPDDEHAWDGKPDFCPSEIAAGAAKDGGKEIARLMREAGDAFRQYLKGRKP